MEFKSSWYLKTYAIKAGGHNTKKYVLIKELWREDKLLQFDYKYSDEVPDGYDIKEEE